MKFGKFGKRLTAAVLTMTMAIQFSAPTMQAAAASTTEYMSELILSYGKTDKEAKDWLTKNGYTVLNQNLNQGGEGGSEALSWLGLSSEKRSVYLGYKTTTDPKEAITDMKIMNMNGGYSYQAYEKILEETKQEKEHFLENLMVALNEYRDNYKAGEIKAQIAHDNLNKFRDDDSGQLMGDLLLNSLKTEDEAAYEADPSQHADMVTILMQGNSTCVSEIMQNLAFGAGTSDTSWLNAALANSGSFDEFFQKFIEEHPGFTEDDAIALMTAEYDDYAKMFASSLVGLRNYLANYTQSGLSVEATQEEADAYFAEHEFESREAWATAANLFMTLSSVFYGDTSLVNYLVYTEDDFLTDSALLDGYTEFNLPQRAKLYPFIAEMSAGERTLLEYTALDRMMTMGLMDENTWASTEATLNDPNYGADALEPCSMYADVNRDDFQVGSIAVTNMAQGKQASTGEAIDNGLFETGLSPITAGLFVGGVAVAIAGVTVFAKNLGTSAEAAGYYFETTGEITKNVLLNSIDDGESIAAKTIIDNGIDFPQMAIGDIIKENSMENLVQSVNRSIEANKQVMEGIISSAQVYQDLAEFIPQDIAVKANEYKAILTTVADNQEFRYGISIKIEYDKDKNPVSLVNTNGERMFFDGKPSEFDEAIQKQHDDFMTKINADIEKQQQQAANHLDDVAENIIANNELVNNLDDALTQAQKLLDELEEYATEGYLFSEFVKTKGLDVSKVSDLTQEQFDEFAKFVNAEDPNSFEATVIEDIQKANAKEVLFADKANNNAQQIGEHLDEIAQQGDDVKEQIANQADEVMDAATGSTFWKWFGAGMAIVGLAMSVYSAWSAIDEMASYYHVEMLPIPRKMVDISYLEDGSSVYVYYDCTRCNRDEMNMQNETLKDYGDLNGDVMKEWLALYTTKDTRAGNPIHSGFTKKVGSNSIPMGKKPLSFFGFDYAVNMTDERFTYNDKANGIYLYYSQSSTPAYSGTAETSNAYIAVGVLSAIGGAGICALMTHLTGKRKKKETA